MFVATPKSTPSASKCFLPQSNLGASLPRSSWRVWELLVSLKEIKLGVVFFDDGPVGVVIADWSGDLEPVGKFAEELDTFV